MSEQIHIDYEALKKEVADIKKAKKKRERKAKIERSKEWWRENGITVAKIVIGGVACITPITIKIIGSVNDVRTKRRLEQVERNKDFKIYDRSLGCYLNLKRKLNRNEIVTMNKRKQNGERIVDILDDLKILK